MKLFQTRLPRGQRTLRCGDPAPTFGYVPADRDNPQMVFLQLHNVQVMFRVELNPPEVLAVIQAWANHALGQGMFGADELGARLSTVPHAEAMASNLLSQMPATMVQRLFEAQRRRLDL